MSDRVLRFLTEPGTSLKDCRNQFGTPPTGRSFTCSKSQSLCLPTRFRSRPLPGRGNDRPVSTAAVSGSLKAAGTIRRATINEPDWYVYVW